MTRRHLVTAFFGGVAAAAVCLTVGQAMAKSTATSTVTVRTLAQGHVKSLQPGKIYLSILEFRQQPGADFGPHSHQASIVYTLQGVDTISFKSSPELSIGPGEAAFTSPQVVHTHQNVEDRFGASAIAAGLILVVIMLCAATWLRGIRRSVAIAALSTVLIAGGMVPLLRATANDYYLFAVRPEVQRTGPMPRPDAWVVYAAPDINPVPAPPYLETLDAITVPAGATFDTPDATGPQMIVVLAGTAAVHIGDLTTQLGSAGVTSAQAGQIISIVNSGGATLQLLDFAVTPNPAA